MESTSRFDNMQVGGVEEEFPVLRPWRSMCLAAPTILTTSSIRTQLQLQLLQKSGRRLTLSCSRLRRLGTSITSRKWMSSRFCRYEPRTKDLFLRILMQLPGRKYVINKYDVGFN